MTISNPSRPVQNSLANNVQSAARRILGNRFGLLAIAALILGLAAYSNWGWLVAAGLAPLLLSIAPCAAMCALGLCSMGMKQKVSPDAQATTILPTDGKPSNHKDCC